MTEIFDDIKKLYDFRRPCEELAPYIEFFSETSIEASRYYIGAEKFEIKLFPSYCPTIWLNLGRPYLLKNGKKWETIDQSTDVFVLRNETIERVASYDDHIFTIKFYPGTLKSIFGINQSKITGTSVDIHELIPAQLLKKIKNLGNFNDRVALLEKLFIEKLNENKNEKEAYYLGNIQHAVNLFNASGLEIKNSQLAEQLALTEKSLYRYFINTIGTSPKNYMAMIRIRAALPAYIKDIKNFTPYEYGYFDRSNFYKSVTNFTGEKLIGQLK